MSGLKRFFVKEIQGETLTLVGDEYNHAANVLRLKAGEEVIVCDNSGWDYTAKITAVAKREMTLSILNKEKNDCEAQTAVTLLCGF